jgi:hypothetical protein
VAGPTHNDAVQPYEGNRNVLLRHNTLALSNKDNAAYQVTQDRGKPSQSLRIENNWLDGGGCTLNFSHKGGPTPTAERAGPLGGRSRTPVYS